MAVVADLSGNRPNNAPNVDNELDKANRYNAGSPSGTLTPLFPGEQVMDTTNRVLWAAIGTTNTSWEVVNEDI